MRGQAEFPEPLSEGEELSTILSFDRCVVHDYRDKLAWELIMRAFRVLEQEEKWFRVSLLCRFGFVRLITSI